MKEDILKMTWELLDLNCKNLSLEDYHDLLMQLSDDAKIRAEGVAEDMETDPEAGDILYH